MNSIAFLESGLFLVLCVICIMIGVYILYINTNALLNKLSYLCSVSLTCWCLGHALSIVAVDYNACLFWRRFAAIGWGTFFSFFLHYNIVVTERTKYLKKVWVRVAIYIPSVVTVYVFAISASITDGIYEFQKTAFGWVNVSNYNIWTVLFNIYYMSFMLICLYMILCWKRKNQVIWKKKQSNRILLSFLVSFILGTMAEVIKNNNVRIFFHLIVPFVLIFPMISICYLISKHDFMKAKVCNDEVIFTEQYRTKIMSYLSGSFCMGGIINFIAMYLQNDYASFRKTFFFSCLLFLFGVTLYGIQILSIKEDLRLILNACFLVFIIPVVTLQFIQYASLTIWAFPFVIIIASLLFHNSTILLMISTSMIITQLYLWIKVPNRVVVIDAPDYTVRLALIGIAIYFIYYINRIYILRLKQLSDKIQSQDLVSNISSRMININNSNLEEKMQEVLWLLCEYFTADRVHIYYAVEEGEENQKYYCYCNEQSKLESNQLQDSSIILYFWWIKEVQDKGIIQIQDVSKLPIEAKDEKIFLVQQKVKSMLAVPLISQEKMIGYLRMDMVHIPREWEEEFVKVLTILGHILGEANIKVNSEKRIHQMAYYDQLTNIPNRQLFGDRINQAIHFARISDKLIGIVFFDLDSFKTVNDTLGHEFGDKLLILVSDMLKQCLRKTDIVSRFGGDEFLIMLNNIDDTADIEIAVAKVMKQFEEPVFIDEQEFYITASAGISIFPFDGQDKETLIKNADIAMYRAKNNGKNQYVFCSSEMKQEVEQTRVLTNYLYHAQEKNELEIVYQPQVSVESGQVIAMEVLARWRHPQLGNIPPSVFIPIAEYTGLINSIGGWILTESCRQNKVWQEMGLPELRLAVNVSVNQLLNPTFTNQVQLVLNETGLNPEYLELEITENIAIQQSDFIIQVLLELKKLGVSLAIDDFGVEYSSLNRIKMLPVDRLKIDMHFIRGILDNEKDRAIVDVIIKLAKDLRLKVIAEGVETEQQVQYLNEKRCDEAQGYYYHKPLSIEDMQSLLINMRK